MDIKEIQSKSILTPSKLPDVDFVVNPYTGCDFGCSYCYASFMGRYNGKDIKEWGDYVFVKTNAPELLEKAMLKLKNKGEGKRIFLSSVTDPYQAVEAKYKLTRQCLEVLLKTGFKGLVSILTKSHMVLRDKELLLQLPNVEVGFTITSTDDKISRYFEKRAPNVTARFAAMKELNDAGIKTYAFVGPLLPHYVAKYQVLNALFSAIADTGTTELYVEHINLSPYILSRFKYEMKDVDAEIMEKFYESKRGECREELDAIVKSLIEKHGLRLRWGDTIKH